MGDYADLLQKVRARQPSPAAIAGAKARMAPADPDAYAKARTLSLETGVPVGVAARNPDQVQQIKQARDIQALATAHPAAGTWMADGHNAALAHDDTPTLGRIATHAQAINQPAGHWTNGKVPQWVPGPAERSLGQMLIDSFKAPNDPTKRNVGVVESGGRMLVQGTEELTSLATKLSLLPVSTIDALAGLFLPANREHPQDLIFRHVVDPQEELIQRLAVDPATEKQSTGAAATGQVAHFVPQLVAAMGTGGGAEAIPLKEGGSVAFNWLKNALLKSAFASPGIAVPAGAQTFESSLDAGDSPATAAAKDAGTMIETVAANAIPMAGKTRTGSAAMGAVGMPAVQTLLSLLHGQGLPSDQDLTVNAIIGVLTGYAFGGKPSKADVAEHNASQLDQLMQAASESKLSTRAPDRLEDFVANMGEHTVYVPEAVVAEHFTAKGEDPALEVAKITGNPDAYMEAEGGLLAIPLSRYVTQGQELHKAIGDSAKLDREGMSVAEVQHAAQAAVEAQAPVQGEGPRTVSTKNASMQEARQARGEEALGPVAMPGKKLEIADALDRMTDNPNLPDEIIARKLAGDTTISTADEAVLQVHAVDLTKQMEAQAARASDPLATPEERAAARLKGEDLAKRFNDLNQATKITGAAWSAFGRQRMQELLRDYSFAALVRKETTRLERPLNAAETAKLKQQADRIAELEAQAQIAQRALDEATGKRRTGPKKSVDERAQERLRADIAKLEATITERLKACPV